ncbi:MAG: hypothetical protein DMF61_12815 [Blastocatellia bacterium AA13]|nr:MAG: hypothetical protein DMF61_12815 [Blastocatellia bacterium AA13]
MFRMTTRSGLIAALVISLTAPIASIAMVQNRSISGGGRLQQESQLARGAARAPIVGDTGFRRESYAPTDITGERRTRGNAIAGKLSEQSLTQRWLSRTHLIPSSLTTQSFGTGGGDILEVEPNDPVAQLVSLPVNVFGQLSFDGDIDFFAFPAFASQPVTIEAFAARLSGSVLIPDIALFDENGNLLAEDVGDDVSDPLIRYTSPRDQVLIAGIVDLFDEGGSKFNYILNVVRGVDVDEIESNDTAPQVLSALPATVFGAINVKPDIDSYAFNGTAGQTLIVDVDAEALGSKLDSRISLKDSATGTELFFNDQYDGDDSRLNITLPFTGQYVVTIGSFEQTTRGFYRLNLSLVPGDGAPVVTGVTKVSKKFLGVTGTGFTVRSTVEVNGIQRPTSMTDANTLNARIKIKSGDVVTVSNLPEDRRSNPVVFQ